MDRIPIDRLVVVEGKYDKIKLQSIISAEIITSDGFSIFNNEEKLALLRKIAEKKGIILLTDSDPAGFFLRNKLKGMLPSGDSVVHLYIPSVEGKEKRKKDFSKAGLLGVEGIDTEILKELFEKYRSSSEKSTLKLTKAELYEIGLSGKVESETKRNLVCENLGLPKGMSANAFLGAVNLLGIGREELFVILTN